MIRYEDLLLSEKLTLYNNLATSGDCSGRLLAELQIYPSPRIVWEFEALGESACGPEEVDEPVESFAMVVKPFIGTGFSVEKPLVTSTGWFKTPIYGQHSEGIAFEATVSDQDTLIDDFLFYLPNARFQQIVRSGRSVEAALDSTWNVRLTTTDEALKWLSPKEDNIGTRITTQGRIYQNRNNELTGLKAGDAQQLLRQLSWLLSFANGGYLTPLCVRARNDRPQQYAAVVSIDSVTPLEQLGRSWLVHNSDLTNLISCFPVFRRMLAAPPWDEGFGVILMWYFQAIQPPDLQSATKSWPVIANAAGAALERLHRWIVVDELGQNRQGKPNERIHTVLHTIGITTDDDEVDMFILIRNDATHAQQTIVPTLPKGDLDQMMWKAIMWIEEILLWRLGYNGKYRDRSQKWVASTDPRYDLSTRDSSW